MIGEIRMLVYRYQRAINEFDKEISNLEKKENSKRKKIAFILIQNKIVSIQKSINKNTSQGAFNSKECKLHLVNWI